MKTVNATGSRAAFGIAAFAGCLMMCAPVMATVAYTYENDDKTYVATVTSAEAAISQEAINVLDSNAITNFVVRGSARLHVDKGSTFTGDVQVNSPVRLSAANSLGVSPGRIHVTTNLLTMSGATVEKPVFFETLGAWGKNTGITVWGPYTSTFKKKVEFNTGGLHIYPYSNSKLIFEGGLEGSGCITSREANGGTIIFTNTPIRLTHDYPGNTAAGVGTPDASGFSRHYIFAVAGNSMKRFAHPDYPFSLGELKTTVDWAFNSSSMTMHFGHDSKWDLCGTEQRVGQFNVKVDTGNPSIITNSSATLATLYMGMMYGPSSSVANIRFGGNLSVIFEKNIYTTIIDHPMTATGDLTVLGNGSGGATSAILQFTENGSWANSTNVTVMGVGKITIANPNALGRRANVNLASNSSLEIASGVTVTVKTLTIGGVQKPRGSYTFGDGTLFVTHPCGLQVRVR